MVGRWDCLMMIGSREAAEDAVDARLARQVMGDDGSDSITGAGRLGTLSGSSC